MKLESKADTIIKLKHFDLNFSYQKSIFLRPMIGNFQEIKLLRLSKKILSLKL